MKALTSDETASLVGDAQHDRVRRLLPQYLLCRLHSQAQNQVQSLHDQLRGLWDERLFREHFVASTRTLHATLTSFTADEIAQLEQAGIHWSITGTLDELGRIVLLVLADRLCPSTEFASLVLSLFRQGDCQERQAVLRALPLLLSPQCFMPLAVDACRSHMQPIFEAIACHNPYPARHFPDLHFNQMVLKGLFTGTALSRIIGLDTRITPELVRMATDYASERRAAGRSVPADIERLLR